MKSLSMALVIIVSSLVAAGSALAMDNGECNQDIATIESLHHCVMHAAEMDHITNLGVANALMSKLDAAQAALDRGQPAVAANILQAFIHQVEAQSGKHIDSEHAAHLIEHVHEVVAAL